METWWLITLFWLVATEQNKPRVHSQVIGHFPLCRLLREGSVEFERHCDFQPEGEDGVGLFECRPQSDVTAKHRDAVDGDERFVCLPRECSSSDQCLAEAECVNHFCDVPPFYYIYGAACRVVAQDDENLSKERSCQPSEGMCDTDIGLNITILGSKLTAYMCKDPHQTPKRKTHATPNLGVPIQKVERTSAGMFDNLNQHTDENPSDKYRSEHNNLQIKAVDRLRHIRDVQIEVEAIRRKQNELRVKELEERGEHHYNPFKKKRNEKLVPNSIAASINEAKGIREKKVHKKNPHYARDSVYNIEYLKLKKKYENRPMKYFPEVHPGAALPKNFHFKK